MRIAQYVAQNARIMLCRFYAQNAPKNAGILCVSLVRSRRLNGYHMTCHASGSGDYKSSLYRFRVCACVRVRACVYVYVCVHACARVRVGVRACVYVSHTIIIQCLC